MFLFATFSLLASMAMAPSEPPPAIRWLGCGGIENSRGTLVVDRLAVVFFDPDSAAINAQAARILDSYVVQYNLPVPSPVCRVTITGHADRVGSTDYNMALSRRRAAAVGAYLHQRGLIVPLLLEAYGENRPLVETADGVPESQNRYVVLVVAD